MNRAEIFPIYNAPSVLEIKTYKTKKKETTAIKFLRLFSRSSSFNTHSRRNRNILPVNGQ